MLLSNIERPVPLQTLWLKYETVDYNKKNTSSIDNNRICKDRALEEVHKIDSERMVLGCACTVHASDSTN